jgi:ACT domain-containing protein
MGVRSMSRVLKAVKEASISVACLLDDIAVDENNDINIFEIEKDIEHIQDQITIIENYFEEVE